MTHYPAMPMLLPHAAPMILIDTVLAHTEDSVTVSVEIRAGIPFFQALHGVPAHVGLEYMAQACGAYAGLQSQHHNEPVRMGFLLGTRNFHATVDWFAPGSVLKVHAAKLLQQESLGVFDCRIELENITLAEAQLKVYQSDTVVGTHE